MATYANNPTEILDAHCQQCGSTDYEDLNTGDQGYTACCNEIVMVGCDLAHCSHGCRYPLMPDGIILVDEIPCLVHGRGHIDATRY